MKCMCNKRGVRQSDLPQTASVLSVYRAISCFNKHIYGSKVGAHYRSTDSTLFADLNLEITHILIYILSYTYSYIYIYSYIYAYIHILILLSLLALSVHPFLCQSSLLEEVSGIGHLELYCCV